MHSRPTSHTSAIGIRGPRLLAGATALALALLSPVASSPASAQEFVLHVEPGAAFWLDTPQSDRLKTGFYAAIRPSLALGRVFSLQWSYSFLFAPPSNDFDDAGVAHALTTGLRLRPFAPLQPETVNLGGLWLDFNLGYVRTDTLDRFGFDTGIGYGFQMSPGFAGGPSVRYGHIVQPDDVPGMDPNDAQFLVVGLNFSFGRAYQPEPMPVVEYREGPVQECAETVCAECVQDECAAMPANMCSDSDGDGVCDDVDRCPTQPGPAQTHGCPTNACDGAALRVLVQFEFDSSEMPVVVPGNRQTMDPVLDAVAAAIGQDSTCRVAIIGHTSEEGTEEYNQSLSERRAAAVQRYMTERGVTVDRIPACGMGQSCPLDPHRSRELNRRVEFIRLGEGESCPPGCLQ